ncbi:MAG TPA: isoleucine--tRNA ligase [Candidatus Saccharimonadales bacterium]|nr:isoleucine--tRNA ligase [Candidatus Saccharimonadales bacterium]
MRFKKGTRRAPIEYENDLVKYWRDNKTFEKSVEMRPKDNGYVFYDGPPFITGIPHTGTLLSSIVKDAVPRYWTMKGRRVERVWGWDCHGLPAEVFTEQKLGIKDRRDIGTKVDLETYVTTCRDNMVLTGSLWEDTIARIGRWVDFKGAYKTMDKEYMESVWWAFKKLYEAGKIYEGEKVLLYCTRDATPISKAEVAMDNSYEDDTDPSVYIKFKVRGADYYLLAWTTTPWTLPANVAVAVNSELEYAEVEVDGEKFVLAKELLDKVLTDEKHRTIPYKMLRTIKGSELVGLEVEPLFESRGKGAHVVYDESYVNLGEGTGIVHSAPAYGEEDFLMAKAEGIPIVSNIDDNGFYTSGEWRGEYVWDANKEIAKELHKRGVIWKIEYVTHAYPHCHRCGTKLMYRAHPSWFMDVEGQRQKMLELNGDINWFPPHIKHGRFEKTVESAPDWNLSRDRFWATAMPVWKGKDKSGNEHIKVVGSYAELEELSGAKLNDYHRPWIDDVTFTIDGVRYKRIDKVLDCWFESGSMPFAQFHYPFENVEKFEQDFPGDFIVEYVGQVRAWFYYLHTVSTGLFNNRAFTNVIVTGTVAGNDGRKMSKHFNNFTDPNLLMDEYSADALRFLLLASPVLNGEDYSLVDRDVANVARKLSMVWNMFDFFTLYAEVDKWEWDGKLEDPSDDLSNPLDMWIVSRLHQLGAEVERYMDGYDLPNAVKPILPFLDDASNWYVRRSRRRFWKSGDDADKQAAYKVLHYVLVKLAHILAPFVPFMAEELYQKLTGGESVHLEDWPEMGHVNELVLQQMADIRLGIEEGLSQRASAGLKVRQPLKSVKLYITHLPDDTDTLEQYRQIAQEELNVKEAELLKVVGTRKITEIDVKVTDDLKREGLARELIRSIQTLRKESGLNVDDRIKLRVETAKDDAVMGHALKEFKEVIDSEVLAVGHLAKDDKELAAKEYNVDGHVAKVALQKHA